MMPTEEKGDIHVDLDAQCQTLNQLPTMTCLDSVRQLWLTQVLYEVKDLS